MRKSRIACPRAAPWYEVLDREGRGGAVHRGTAQVPEPLRAASGSESFDPVETAILLISDEAHEVEEGFRRVYERYRRPLLAFISGKYGIDEHGRLDVLREVFRTLCEMVRDDRFDPDGPLDPLMFELAKRRAVDHVRRKSARRDGESYSGDNDEDTIADLGAFLADTTAGDVYAGLTAAEKNEALELMWQAIRELPPRERLTMQVKWQRPHESVEELRARASKAGGEELTYTAVKKAIQRAEDKVSEVLARKAYRRGFR
jgi:RNA polymerase sigma factor (sigma-70 family)